MAQCLFAGIARLSLQRTVCQVLPHHLLSRLGGWAARRRAGPLTTLCVRWFVRRYAVNLAEAAQTDPGSYATFNAFFTRALRADVRAQPDDPAAVTSPVDGVVSAAGDIRRASLLQAKGRMYPVARLLASEHPPYDDGHFATLYLRPQDYHRVHAPLAGNLVAVRRCGGRLWPVRPWAVRELPELFCANERLVLEFDSAAGRYALVMVGALMVGGLETVVTGAVRRRRRDPACWNLDGAPRSFARGEEVGRFNFGSTVILVFQPGRVALDHAALGSGREVRVGQVLGRISG